MWIEWITQAHRFVKFTVIFTIFPFLPLALVGRKHIEIKDFRAVFIYSVLLDKWWERKIVPFA